MSLCKLKVGFSLRREFVLPCACRRHLSAAQTPRRWRERDSKQADFFFFFFKTSVFPLKSSHVSGLTAVLKMGRFYSCC